VSQVRISIDGATAAVHDLQRQRDGSLQRATRAVSYLRAAGVAHVGTVSTLTRHNVHQMSDIIDLAYNAGAHAIQILVVAQSGRGDDNYDTLSVSGAQAITLRTILRDKRAEYEGRMLVSSNDGLLRSKASEAITAGQVFPDYMGCQAARTCCNIDYNGDVIPCLLVRRPVAGNVRDSPFAEIWRHASAFEAWRQQASGYVECSSCRLHEVCNRECPLSESQQVFTSTARMRSMKARVWNSQPL
jgi:radical SAM protein with 4Fe4S-binding SPASM domain